MGRSAKGAIFTIKVSNFRMRPYRYSKSQSHISAPNDISYFPQTTIFNVYRAPFVHPLHIEVKSSVRFHFDNNLTWMYQIV